MIVYITASEKNDQMTSIIFNASEVERQTLFRRCRAYLPSLGKDKDYKNTPPASDGSKPEAIIMEKPDQDSPVPYYNLITSHPLDVADFENNIHYPCIDLDIPCYLIPSSTPGHSHLYIDHKVSWEDYKKVLYALAEAGIVETGYVEASIARGFTALRPPELGKDPTVNPFLSGLLISNANLKVENYRLQQSEQALLAEIQKLKEELSAQQSETIAN